MCVHLISFCAPLVLISLDTFLSCEIFYTLFSFIHSFSRFSTLFLFSFFTHSTLSRNRSHETPYLQPLIVIQQESFSSIFFILRVRFDCFYFSSSPSLQSFSFTILLRYFLYFRVSVCVLCVYKYLLKEVFSFYNVLLFSSVC